MAGARDEEHLTFALAGGRVIFTQDADFLRLHTAGHPNAGIVYAPQQATTGAILRTLMLVYDVLTPEDMTSHVEFV